MPSMTADKAFFTEAKIVPDMEPKLKVRDSVAKDTAVPFMDKYTIKMSENGVAVFDGGKLIASMGRLNDLVVDPAYRGQKMGQHMVVAWRTRFPKVTVTHTPLRTAGGDAVYKKAFKELYPDREQAKPEVKA